MKKAVGLLGILSILLFAVQAQAVTLGEYADGALVPSVYHDGALVDTVVGITCQFQCSANGTHVPSTPLGGKAKIHWTFYDVDSHHVTDGNLICTDDDLVGFSWKAESGRNLDKVEGYLVFHMMTQGVMMSANAFLVDQQAKDAIFIPVIPLTSRDFGTNPSDPDQLINLENGISSGTPIDVRYWMDPTYNAATTIVVWLVDPYVDSKNKAIPLNVIAWNDEERPKSVTIELPHELNKIIPCEIQGMPLDYVDGFISMTIPATPTDTVAGFAYSYISSSLFGAQQTLLAAECNGPVSSPSQPSCGCSGAGR